MPWLVRPLRCARSHACAFLPGHKATTVPPMLAQHHMIACGGVNRAISALALRGSLAEALKMARGALAESPDDTHLLNNVGCILMFALGETSWTRAEDCFRRALRSDALNAAAMHNYGMLLSARPHSHRHNKKCAAKQLIRAACQLNAAIPPAFLTARDILLESSTTLSPGSRDDDSSTSSTETLDASHAAEDSSAQDTSAEIIGRGGECQIKFGVNSQAHARMLLASAQAAGQFGGMKEGRSGQKRRARTAHSDGASNNKAKQRRRRRVVENSARESDRCMAAIATGDSTSLLFCTSLCTSKVIPCTIIPR